MGEDDDLHALKLMQARVKVQSLVEDERSQKLLNLVDLRIQKCIDDFKSSPYPTHVKVVAERIKPV